MMSEKRSVKLVALTLALLAVMLLVIVAGCTVWRTCGKCTDCSGTTYFGLSSSESVSEAPPVAPTRAKDGFEAREPQTKAPYKTVVSLTTLPERLIHPSFLDKCLLLQEACSHDENCTIQINIPFYTMKHVPYVIPTSIQELQANKFHIYRDIQDVGPITKLMGALTNPGIAEESYIIIVDDDIPYKKDFVKLLQTSFDKNPGRHIHCMCNASIAGYKGFGFQKKLFMQMVDMTMPKECMRVDDDYIQFVSEKLEINAVSVPYYGDTSIYCSCDIHIHDDEEKSIQWSRLKYDDRTTITPKCKIAFYEGFTNNVYTNYKNNDYQESNDLDLINDKNCEIITTYLANNNQISELRKQNIINNFKNRYNFNIDFVEGIKYKRWEKTEQFESTLNLLERFEKSNYTYGIICQDDFFPINNFLSELNRTVALLPDTWECLHLCPGFLWGRKFRDKSKIGQLNPEYYMDKNKFDYHTSGRFFINCDPKTYYEHSMWVGGPVAFIIKHTAINKFIKDYKQNFDNDDRALVRIFNINTFICRNPQLGYEEECGGTSLK